MLASVRDRAVEAQVRYLSPMLERPSFHPGDSSRTNLALEDRDISIRDMRPVQDMLSLDREGFVLVHHSSAVSDFRNADQIRDVYRHEVAELITSLTGATKVVVAERALSRLGERSADFGARGTTYALRMIHTDYTPNSGPGFVSSMLTPEEMRYWRGRRAAGFSVWRAVSEPPHDMPLAVCDATSIEDADLMPADVTITRPDGDDITWEGGFLRHNPLHRWGYFSNMRRDEALVFKMCDSDARRAEQVFHTAFDDPSAPADAAPRESVDIRAVALFDD